jgi:A/G-specific adenine glycosylase
MHLAEPDYVSFLAWATRHRRDLPWRSSRDPWHVLALEVMLQQTQAERVVPKWHEFVELWPTPSALVETARAVLVFAFEQRQGVVDTNVGRLSARWCGRLLGPEEAQLLADQLVPSDAWAWNQGLLDLGATTCRPSAPGCHECPASWCGWRGDVSVEDPERSGSRRVRQRCCVV